MNRAICTVLGLGLSIVLSACVSFTRGDPGVRQDLEPIGVLERYPILLPDLVIRGIRCDLRPGNIIGIIVRVANHGHAPSPPFNVTVELRLSPPFPPITLTSRFLATIPEAPVGPGQTPVVQDFFVGQTDPLPVPVDPLHPVTFPMDGWVDKPTAGAPGGEIWEADETNNSITRMCQVP